MRDSREDRPWNMSEDFLRSLMETARQITEVRSKGNLIAFYDLCNDLSDRCFFQFNEEQNAKLRELLDEAKAYLTVPHTQQGQQLLRANSPKIEKRLSMFYRMFWIFLNEYERIFARIHRQTWEQEVQADFS